MVTASQSVSEASAEENGLLDTNVVIQLNEIAAEELPAKPLISAVTLAELSVGPLVASTEEERSVRQAVLQQAEADFDPIPFDAASARAFGRVATALRRAGRKTTSRGFDAMIAATAIANRLTLYTANPDDFTGIGELSLKAIAPRK
ncbi:MAG: type II toxin-antitoxin system VapC family toxin [Trueperaceae bacterium]|nr:type II toxin-antitoxin system VapC family toxin [Trueperaceae bacterium]